jgi:hypothetical protein
MDLGKSLPWLATLMLRTGGELKSQSFSRISFPDFGSRNTKAPPDMASSVMPLYETLTELISKLKSSEVDRGVRAMIENPTDPHSLALVSGSRTNGNMSSRHFSLSCLVSM